jgi:predicted DNA-binding transcriptional regulator YafY
MAEQVANALPYSFEVLMRYRLIEIIALWEGRLTTNHLCQSFQIKRQQASKDINKYNQDIAPSNLVLDRKLKGYRPSPTFTPVFTRGIAEEYLLALASNRDISHNFSTLDLGFHQTEMLHAPMRHVDPQILRALVQAARDGEKIDMGYVSMTSPNEESRIITPHTLVCTPLRWHVRAYCEKNRDYRDFVLSRFRSINGTEGPSANLKDQDSRWNTEVSIVLKPDHRLTSYQRAIVEHDYGMVDGQHTVRTRSALVPYLIQQLNLDLSKLEIKPEAQQIVVDNLEEVKKHTF